MRRHTGKLRDTRRGHGAQSAIRRFFGEINKNSGRELKTQSVIKIGKFDRAFYVYCRPHRFSDSGKGYDVCPQIIKYSTLQERYGFLWA